MKIDLKKPPNRRHAATILMLGAYLNQAILVVQGLVFMPLYLHLIGERVYGLWLATGSILAWLGFMDMGIGNLIVQRVSSAYGKRDFDAAAKYFVNGFAVVAVLTVLFCTAIFMLSFPVPVWLKASGPEIPLLRTCFQIGGLAAAAELMNNSLRNFAQALQQPFFTMLVMILCRITGLAAVGVLLFHGYRLWALPIGLLVYALPALFMNIYYCFYLIRELGGTWDLNKNMIRDFCRLGPITLVSKMGNSLASNIEPTIIAAISRPELVTAYVISKRAADMIVLFIHFISSAIFPSFVHLYAEGDKEKSRRIFSNTLSFCFSVSLIGFGIFLASNRSFVSLWVGAEQFLGNEVTLFIAMGSLMVVVNLFFVRFLFGMGDIVYSSVGSLSEAFFRVILMAFLLYWFGFEGFIFGIIVSGALFCLVYMRRVRTKIPMMFNQSREWIRNIILFMVIFGIAFCAARYLSVPDTWLNFAVYFFAMAGLFLVINLFFNMDFRSMVLNLIDKNAFLKERKK